MVVYQDPVSWDRKTEEEPTKRPSGRKTISGRGNSMCESEELGGLWELQAGQWGQGGMMFMAGVGSSQATGGLRPS